MKWDEITRGLKDILTDLYTEEATYRTVARESGLYEKDIKIIGRASNDWSEIFLEADKHKKLLDIISRARKEYPENTELKQLADEYIRRYTAPQRDSRSTSKSLPSDITTVYDNYLEILQLKREIAEWVANPEDLLPKNMSQVQQSIQRLSNLTKDEYSLLEKDSDLRDFFGQSRYDFMATLSRISERSDNLAVKIPIFIAIFSPQSIVALTWQQEIQQHLKRIIHNLQDIDNFVQPLQTPLSDKEIGERIFQFYKVDELIELFHNLSQICSDPGLEYDELPGKNVKEKIAMLFQYTSKQGTDEQVKEHLLNVPGFTDELL